MILSIPFLEITDIEETRRFYNVNAASTSAPDACPYCSEKAIYKHGEKIRVYMDTPIYEKFVRINLKDRRYFCRSCKKTFSEKHEGISDRHRATNRLITYIMQQSAARANTSIADEVGLSEGSIRNILKDQANT